MYYLRMLVWVLGTFLAVMAVGSLQVAMIGPPVCYLIAAIFGATTVAVFRLEKAGKTIPALTVIVCVLVSAVTLTYIFRNEPLLGPPKQAAVNPQ